MYGALDCAEVGRERLNDKRPAKNTLAFYLKSDWTISVLLQKGDRYLAIHGSGNITVEKFPGFQRRCREVLPAVISIIIIIVEVSIDDRKGGGSKSAMPFANTLINLGKGVVIKITTARKRTRHLLEQRQALGLWLRVVPCPHRQSSRFPAVWS